MAPTQTTVLITGANRGIGKGLVTAYLSRPNTTVIGTARNASSAQSSLKSIIPASGSSLIVVQLDQTIPASAETAITELRSKHSVGKLDVVIANAGIANYYGLASETPDKELEEHLAVNAVGTLRVYKAVFPLLKAAADQGGKPAFVALSTAVASIKDASSYPVQATAYGASKAAVNYMLSKIHGENEWLIAFPISPGWVQTEMGNAGAVSAGLPEAPVTVADSVGGIIAVIDGATKEKTSGQFLSFDATYVPW